MITTHKRSRWLAAAALCAVAVAAFVFRAKDPADPLALSKLAAPLEPLRVAQPPVGDSLRPALRQLLDPATPPRLRIDLAMGCDPDLGDGELEALLAEVSTPMAAGGDLGWHSQYLHEICRQLQRHDTIRQRFARVLAGIALDGDRARIERDYAIQHLRQVWHRAADDEGLRQSVLLSFKSLVDGGPEVAGPAILSLHFLGGDPAKPWKASSAVLADGEIAPPVAGILQRDPVKTDTGTFMAALRVAGDRKLPETTGRIAEIAANVSAAAVVRMAAISIIARSGGDSASFLQSIDRTDRRVDQAVRLALNKSR